MRTTISLGGVLLPGGLLWKDEYDSPVISESMTPLLSGVRYIEESSILSGRPVTLATGDDQVLLRSHLLALRATMTSGNTMTLILTDDSEYAVRWRHSDGAIEAVPAGYHLNPPAADTPYFATLRLEIV